MTLYDVYTMLLYCSARTTKASRGLVQHCFRISMITIILYIICHIMLFIVKYTLDNATIIMIIIR